MPTRWNSTYDMLERTCALTPVLNTTLADPSVKTSNTKYFFTFDDQQLVDYVLKLLKPFKDAKLTVSIDSSPALPTMYPTYLKLVNILKVEEDDFESIKKMKNAARSNLEGRYRTIPDAVLISSFLCPRTKQLNFISPDQRTNVHKTVKQELSKITTCDVTTSTSAEADGPSPEKHLKLSHNSALDWLDDIVQPTLQTEDIDRSSKCELEFMHYMAEPDSKEDPLDWWKTMEPVFPLLSRLAKKYLCIPASSVPAERIFSTAGNLVNRNRASLSAENIDMLLFLNKNFEQLNI